MRLSELHTKRYFELPGDDIVNELIIPAMKISDEVLIESAYFSNQGLAQIAPGLSELIQNDQATLKLIISLKGISDEETLESIRESTLLDPSEIEDMFLQLLEACKDDQLHKFAKDCLTYLLASGKAELRLVGMANAIGIYHKKVYIFRHREDQLTITGSANFTHFGFNLNGEILTADVNPEEDFFVKGFHKTWNGQNHEYETYEPSAELMEEIKLRAPVSAPDHEVGKQLIDKAILDGARVNAPTASIQGDQPAHEQIIERLKVPVGLNVDSGKYKHQGDALEKLKENNYSGMLCIATGGGKTKTSLVAATRVQDSHPEQNTVVIVLVPTSTLVDMWAEDVIGFGCNAIKLSKFSSGNRNQLLSRLQLALKTSENAKTIVMLSTMQLFTQDHAISEFFETLSPESTQTIFIGDEAHRLGSAGFIKKNPKHFDYIIGLSATPTRAFDEEGSEFLKQYFGEEIYSFSIGDAIQSKCLTPYKYYFHLCRQTEDEYEEFIRIHGQIKKQQAMKFDDDLETQESLKSLLFKRTSLINQTASKISVLDNFISKTDDIERALFFASAGATNPNVNPEKIKQLDEVNSILNSHSIHYHQLTSEESGSNQAQHIQNKFKKSEYQAITSMRVLDEGVDLPMATTAFLVGSSKSEREWIQRRGRVLRTSPGKEFAIIHDFVTLPFVNQSVDSNWIVDSEIKRLTAFVKDSVNQHIDGEGWDAIEKYRDIHGDS